MIALIVSLKIKPDQRERFLAAAEDDSTCSVRDEEGCFRFDVLEDQADPTRFYFYEVYRDEAALEAHRQSAHYPRWRAAAEQVLAEPSVVPKATVMFPKDYK